MLIASKTRLTRVASASGGKKKNILHQFSGFTGRWYTDEEVHDTKGGKEGVEEKGEQDASGEGTDMEGKGREDRRGAKRVWNQCRTRACARLGRKATGRTACARARFNA
jgi:hypothetical protein